MKSTMAPEPDPGQSLLLWLLRPATWTGTQRLAIGVLTLIVATLMTVTFSRDLADMLAITAYLILLWLLLLLVWRRLVPHE